MTHLEGEGMNRFVIALLIGTLLGCQATPPRDNPWDDVEPAVGKITQQRPLPDLPNLVEVPNGILMSSEGFDELQKYRIVAEGNFEIATATTTALEEMSQAHNDLLRAGQAEFEIGELQRVLLVEERLARLWDKIFYGGVAILGVIIGLQ